MTRPVRSGFARQVLRFLGVGGVAFVVDVSVFNALQAAGLDPIVAKVGSSAIAITIAYVGNRSVTFVGAQRHGVLRQAVMFLAVNAAAAGIAIGCLWTSQHVLGLSGPVADNIAANVVGVAVGMVVRFFLYRLVVFHPPRAQTFQEARIAATDLPAPASGLASERGVA